MDEIMKKKTLYDVEETIASLPKGLPAIYDRMLLQIEPEYRQITSCIFQWLALATRHLTAIELLNAIALETPVSPRRTISDYLVHCGPFVRVRGGKVSLVHTSAKDYLLREEPDINPYLEYFRIQPEEAHSKIAWRSLDSMMARLTFESSQKRNTKIPGSDLVCYASDHWAEHARLASKEAEVLLSHPSAIFGGNLDIMRIWQRHQTKQRSQRRPSQPLHIASFLGIDPCVARLAEATQYKFDLRSFCRPINLPDQDMGKTALQYAVEEERHSTVSLLLKNGADTSAKDRHGQTALHYAARIKSDALFRIVLEHRSSRPKSRSVIGDTPLHIATLFGSPEMVRLLIQHKADVHAVTQDGMSVLDYAALTESDTKVRLLLKAGADVHATKTNVLEIALRRSNPEVVKLLVDAGADLYAGEGALQAAFMAWPSREMIQILTDAGADVNMAGGRYGCALQAACFRGSPEDVEFLLGLGADVNIRGGYFGDALQAASSRGNEQMVKLLLDAGADVNAKGGYYGSALKAAQQSKKVSLLLRNAGARE